MPSRLKLGLNFSKSSSVSRTLADNEGMSERDIDRELVTQVLTGDKEAFDLLVLKYQEAICRVIHARVPDHMLVKDLAQETFINAYRSLENFKGNSAFYTWLYRIAVNICKNHYKRAGRRPPDTDIDFKEAVLKGRLRIHDASTPDCLLERDELQEAVLTAVNKLPDELRTSIILREMGGLSYGEIAEVMQCPVGTVRSRIFRARTVIDEKIKPMLF